MDNVTQIVGLMLADNALARAFGSAVMAFLFVQAMKLWPPAKSPDWRPRALAIGTALALNVAAEYVQMEQGGATPLWWRAGLLGFGSGTAIVALYPVIKPILPKVGGDE